MAVEERQIFSKIWIRQNTDNLIFFKTKTGNSSVVGGSEIHCYKGTYSTATFTADISDLENGKTYSFACFKDYGDKPQSCSILNSSSQLVKSLSATLASWTDFKKTADMKYIKVTINPTKKTSVRVMLSTSRKAYVPFIQKIKEVHHPDSVGDDWGISLFYKDSVGNPILMSSAKYDVIRYKTQDGGKMTPNTNSKYYSYIHKDIPSWKGDHRFLLLFPSNNFPDDLFGGSKLTMLFIPKGMYMPYKGKMTSLAPRGDLYIHKDSPLLTETNFLINFNGWRLFLYDRDIDDIVGLNDMSGTGGYAYGN